MRLPTRRSILMTGAATLAAPLILPRHVWAADGRRPILLPPLAGGRVEDGVRIHDLSVAAGETAFQAGPATRTIGVNGSYLGPVVQMRAGERVRMNVTNGIHEDITLHWHGLHLPAAADGGPHQSIRPGATWTPEFDVMQKAGTFWFHGHQMHKTGEHVWAGMAGLIRVEDEESDALGLPSTYGTDDFNLVFQDRFFTDDGQMPYAPNMHNRMAGYSGDRAMVNGTLDAYLEVPRGLVRLRLLNASNASFYNLRLADGRGFHQIASDGGLLAEPVARTEVLLSPAERAEIVVRFDGNAPVMLTAQVFGPEVGMMGGMGSFDFVEFRPTGPVLDQPALPARLADLPAADPAASTNRRDLVLEMGRGGMMGMAFTINGTQMDMDRIDFTVPVGSTETWVLRNTTPMFHPIHIHDTQFRILSRDKAPLEAHELGLKDTVLLWPGETAEVQCHFADFTDPDLPYMYHCHVLEHEDAGMMGQFTVV